MHNIIIRELPGIIDYLTMRWLLDQYRKQKQAIQSWIIRWAFFKKREPIQSPKKQVYYFRINKKYRALIKYKDGIYVVYEIDDHQ